MRTRLPSLWGRDHRDPFTGFQHDMERMFADVAKRWPLSADGGKLGMLSPDVDIEETDSGLELTAELPGVAEKDIDLSYHDGVLTLRGEKKSEREEKEEGRYLSERVYGSFQRSLTVPFEIDEDKVEATFDNGVLKVMLPRSPETERKARKIEVKGGG